MWKLVFLIATWLVHPRISASTEEISSIKTDFETVLDRIADDLLLSISKAHPQIQSRPRRHLSDMRAALIDDTGVSRLSSIIPVAHLCSPAMFIQFLDVEDLTYAICVSSITQYSPAEVIVGTYQDRVWTPRVQWYINNPNGLAAFCFNQNIYVLVAESEKKGIDLVKINMAFGKDVDHTISSDYASSISLWKMNLDDKYHLAVANIPAYNSTDLVADVFVYEWFGTYFDRYQILQGFDVKDIEPFHIYGMAYLAIANYQRGDSLLVDSEILKYKLDKRIWIPHQKIRTYGATDFEFFELGYKLKKDFFLAVANKESDELMGMGPMVYKFIKDKFVPFQCLPGSATTIASWKTETQFMLAVATFEGMDLYQYDGWVFIRIRAQYIHGSMAYGEKRMVFHSVPLAETSTTVLGVSNPQQPGELSVFEIGFEFENRLKSWYGKSKDWCYNTLQTIESTNTDSAIKLLDDVVFIDQQSPITINGSLYFENGFETSKLKTTRLKEIRTDEVYDNTMLLELQDLQNRLHSISTRLNRIDDVLKNSLKLDGDQTVFGSLKFDDVTLDCQNYSCHLDNIDTLFLNGEDVTNWNSNLVFLDQEQVINGTLYANDISAYNLHVLGKIDDVDSEALVTKSGHHVINSLKTFTNGITANELRVSGLIDGERISSDNVLLTIGTQGITGNLSFEDLETTSLDVSGRVNGVNLNAFYEDVVMTDEPSIISGTKIFQDIVVDDLTMIPGSTINGIDIDNLFSYAMRIDGEQEIYAPMEFDFISAHENIIAPKGIDGIQIPGPRVVNINDHTTFRNPVFFENSLVISDLNVINSLNGYETIKVEGSFPKLDILMKNGDQVITGKKSFQTIHLDADSYVSGTVNAVDLSEYKAITLHRETSHDLNRTWIFKNLEIKGPLTANKVDGYDLDYVYQNALKLTDRDITEITFKDKISVEELESRDINNIDIEKDLVLKNKTQIITGKKTFENVILEEDAEVLRLINNLNVSFLKETILRVGSQKLQSKTIDGNARINNLTVKGSINGIPVSEFISLRREESIMHSRELVNVTFNRIEANDVQIGKTVNNIDIEKMMENTVRYEGYEIITGKKTVNGTIYVADEDDLTIDYINGIDIEELWNDAVLLDGPQTISGIKTFTHPVLVEDLVFKHSIDGISEFQMQNWMLRDTPQIVKGNVYFNDLSIKKMDVRGYMNGINITEFNASVVKTNEPTNIEGPVVFDNVLISSKDITLSGKIQGVDLSEEAVTRGGPKVISGVKTFTKDLVVEGDVTVLGLVDGISVEDVCEKALLMKNEQNITHLTIKGDVTILGGGTVKGKISGVDLKELKEKVITNDPEIIFSGKNTFKNLTIEGPLIIEGLFGGVDLNFLNRTYMSRTRYQEITLPMEFTDVTFKGTVSAKSLQTANKMVDNIDVSNLYKRILRTDGTQSITAHHHYNEIIFSDDVFVAGKVNGLEVPNGLMRHNMTNNVHSPKIFESTVKVRGDLTIEAGRQIQGISVSDWSRKAVMKDGGSFTIDGYKTFHDLILFDAKVNGLVDGLKVTQEDLLMIYGEQQITAFKTIRNDVTITGSLTINGLVNDVDFNRLSKNTLQHGQNNIFTKEVYFTQPLNIGYLQADLVDGVNITKLREKLSSLTDFSPIQNRLDEISYVLTEMQEAINKQGVVFQYYELFQEFNIPTAYEWLYISGIDCGEFLLLSDNSSSVPQCSSLRLFRYDEEKEEFTAHPQDLLTSHAVAVKSMYVFEATYLFVANQVPNPMCYGAPGYGGYEKTTSDIYVWNGDVFEIFQRLEMPPLEHMVVFKDGRLACIVFLELFECKVYCSIGRGYDFELKEILPTRGGRKASIVNSEGMIVLAIAAVNLNPWNNVAMAKKPVDIFIWNSENSQFGDPIQGIMSTYAQSILLMDYNRESTNHLFLIIANGRIPRIQNEPKLLVYKYDKKSYQFQKYQQINDYGELEGLILESGECVFFALDPLFGQVKLYEYKGASGFVKVDTIASIGSVSIHAFIRYNDVEDTGNHYLALAGPWNLMAQTSQPTDYAKILKSKVKARLFSNI